MSTNFPTSLDSYTTWVDNTDTVVASIPNNIQDAIEALEAKVGINSSAVTTSLDYKVNNFFTSGRKLWLYENTAPTGWSTVSVTDKVLAVKGGSGSYNISGGNTGGDFSHTHTGPYHNHQWYNYVGTTSASQSWSSGGSATNFPSGTLLSHNPGFRGIETLGSGESSYALATDFYTSKDGTGSTGGSSTFRPAAAVGIIIQKT